MIRCPFSLDRIISVSDDSLDFLRHLVSVA